MTSFAEWEKQKKRGAELAKRMGVKNLESHLDWYEALIERIEALEKRVDSIEEPLY